VTSSGRRRQSPARIAWLTTALVGLCFGWLVWAEQAARAVEARARSELAAAADYFNAHPYLVPPPAVEARLGAQGIETRRTLHQGGMRRRNAAPIPEELILREQAELDRLASRSREALEALPARRFGLRASAPEPLAFASHAFAHAGWLPLVGSLGALLLLGSRLELALGPLSYGLLALGSLLASGGLFALANRGLEEPLIGTAGLLAGLSGAAAGQGGPWLRRPAGAGALVLVLAWLLLPHGLGSDWSLAPPAGAGAGASLWACAGGLGFGLLASLGLRAAGLPARRASGGAAPAPELVRPRLERALQARAEGELDSAFALLSQFLREAPDDREAGLALWEVGRELGRHAEAAQALLRVVRGELRRGDTESALRHWLDLRTAETPLPRDPALLIRLAPHLAEAGHHEAAIEALRSALSGAELGDAATVSTRVARLAQQLDPEIAEQAAWRALGSLALSLDERRSLEALLAQLYRTGAESSKLRAGDPEASALELREVVETGAGATEGPGGTGQWVDPALLADALRSGSAPGAPASPGQPGPREPGSAGEPASRTAASPGEPGPRALEVVEAVPLELAEEGLRVEVEGVGKKRLRYQAVGAIGVGAVRGLAGDAVILVDLVLDWGAGGRDPLRLVRLRSDRFDARRCMRAGESSAEGLRLLIEELLARTGAVPLPDASSARGVPFARFADLRSYEREVLRLGGEGSDDERLLL
jgi:membrane associated rhomboid family serine protease